MELNVASLIATQQYVLRVNAMELKLGVVLVI